jgi:hypothetical protein
MCMTELATKTITADKTIGSQRAASETIDNLPKHKSEFRNSHATLRWRGAEVKAAMRPSCSLTLRSCGLYP